MPYIPRTVAPQVARSFDTWAANHKKIYFTDVTDLCRNITGNGVLCSCAVLALGDVLCRVWRCVLGRGYFVAV